MLHMHIMECYSRVKMIELINIDKHFNISEPWKYYAKWRKLVTNDSHLQEMPQNS